MVISAGTARPISMVTGDLLSTRSREEMRQQEGSGAPGAQWADAGTHKQEVQIIVTSRLGSQSACCVIVIINAKTCYVLNDIVALILYIVLEPIMIPEFNRNLIQSTSKIYFVNM